MTKKRGRPKKSTSKGESKSSAKTAKAAGGKAKTSTKGKEVVLPSAELSTAPDNTSAGFDVFGDELTDIDEEPASKSLGDAADPEVQQV